MIFDADGDLRKLFCLIIRQAGTGAFFFRQIHAADAFLGVADEFSGLGADHFFNDRHGRLSGGHKKVAGHAAVHHGFGKTPYGIDKNAVIAAGDRVPGINDPAGYRIHHDQAPDAHQDVFVPEAPVHSVGNGLKAVFAGDHFLISLKDVLKADIELRAVLAGKRAAFGVFSQRAAAKRNRNTAAAFRFQIFPGAANGFLQIIGNTGADHELLGFGAERIERIDIAGIDCLELSVDFHLKAVVVHEALEGGGCDHEARGDFQMNAVLDFAEVGHFAAGNFGHVLVQGIQRKNQAAGRQCPGLL